MRAHYLIIFTISSLLFSCNDNEEKTTSKADRFELVPEPDKAIRLEYEKQQAESLNADGNNLDSLATEEEISKSINEFYSWYLKSIKDQEYEEFRPSFGEDENGRATLHLDKYVANIKKYRFSDALIKKEINSYQTCIENLNKISYKEFKETWLDLGDYEKTNCDFTNYYRWIGGQEPMDTLKISGVKRIDTVTYQVNLDEGYYDVKKEEFEFYRINPVTFVKENGLWKIDKIESNKWHLH